MIGVDQQPSGRSRGSVVSILALSGSSLVVAGIALGFVLEPFLFALVPIGILDFALAYMFSTGRLGQTDGRGPAVAAGEEAAVAELDPSVNPYARED
jgi:hypothetical protein